MSAEIELNVAEAIVDTGNRLTARSATMRL